MITGKASSRSIAGSFASLQCLLLCLSLASASFRDHPKFIKAKGDYSSSNDNERTTNTFIVWKEKGATESTSIEALRGFEKSYVKQQLKVVLNGGYILSNVPGKSDPFLHFG